jgi:hypothetical protein
VHKDILKGNLLWSFAIYVQDEPFSAGSQLSSPVKVFNSKRLKLGPGHPRDQADPFPIVHGETLYVFYEKLLPGGVGTIACARTADLRHFEDLGVILAEPHHLSYPFVFMDGADALLLPEAKQSGEVALYEFASFPFGPRKIRSLLTGRYVDSFLLKKDGLWYLFTTSGRGLEIFFTDDLRSGAFSPHPRNPVVTDPRYSRSGGGPFEIDGSPVRVAQDCSESYGRNVSLVRIDELSPDRYAETLVRPEFFEKRDGWNRLGAHHLAVETFHGKTVIAADGQSRDYLVNKLFSRLWR